MITTVSHLQRSTTPAFGTTHAPGDPIRQEDSPMTLPQTSPVGTRSADNRVKSGLEAAAPKMFDAIWFFIAGNLLPIIGHATLWPLSGLSAGLALNDLRKGAGIPPLAASKDLETLIKQVESAYQRAKQQGSQWESKVRTLSNIGLATTLLGLVIHPLLVPGVLLWCSNLMLNTAGFAYQLVKELLQKRP